MFLECGKYSTLIVLLILKLVFSNLDLINFEDIYICVDDVYDIFCFMFHRCLSLLTDLWKTCYNYSGRFLTWWYL